LTLRFAILVPAHNEAALLERKIRSTHQLHFEASPAGLTHLALIVDDHSTDGTAELARRTIAALAPRPDLEWRVISNPFEPGKGSALRAGFEEAAGYDVMVMTDADAIVAVGAPLLTARALARASVGAVTGTQRYVTATAGPGPVESRMEPFDVASEAVRRLESRARAVFSVHGPWFAVRASTGARPTPGVGADDLDLAIQVRRAGHGIVLLTDVPFWEVKPEGASLTNQQLRRARAYFEVMDRHWRGIAAFRPRPWGALQYAAYAWLPPAAALTYLALCAWPTVAVARATDGVALPLAACLATAGVLLWAPFRPCLRLALVILTARFSPHRRAADRWIPVVKPS
jgi:cellulose synthase/poly-beta-1,6-N-acetylglucosamine synthase-like glycosyltransferase